MLEKLNKYKYPVTLAIFALWMLFFDRNNMIEQYRLHRQKDDLLQEKTYYLSEKEKAEREYNELFSNEANLEKFAREKYLMKRDNEDIFVIVEKED